MLEFGPLCLDLGHFAMTLAMLLGFGLFGRIWQHRPQRRQSPEDGVGGTDVRMDGRTDSPCVL